MAGAAAALQSWMMSQPAWRRSTTAQTAARTRKGALLSWTGRSRSVPSIWMRGKKRREQEGGEKASPSPEVPESSVSLTTDPVVMMLPLHHQTHTQVRAKSWPVWAQSPSESLSEFSYVWRGLLHNHDILHALLGGPQSLCMLPMPRMESNGNLKITMDPLKTFLSSLAFLCLDLKQTRSRSVGFSSWILSQNSKWLFIHECYSHTVASEFPSIHMGTTETLRSWRHLWYWSTQLKRLCNQLIAGVILNLL